MLNNNRVDSKEDWNGVLLVDKPAGCTSFQVVRSLKKHLSVTKVGHAGTLDPCSTGLMIILLGKATKLSLPLMSTNKVYEGTFKLGEETDTQDAEGTIVSTSPVIGITEETLRLEMKCWLGDQYQTPPMFSAKKINGTPLYKLARKGQVAERKPHFISVFSFELIEFELPFVSFRLQCSKGTYVRAIVSDLGKNLGCGAHLTALRRTVSGNFTIGKAVALDKLLALPRHEVKSHLITPQDILQCLQP